MRGAPGPEGTAGPHGPQGIQGVPGVSNLLIVSAISRSDSVDKSGVALCSAAGNNLYAIGGGAMISGVADGVGLVETRPVGLEGEIPSGWQAKAVEVNEQSGDWTLTVYAVCASVN